MTDIRFPPHKGSPAPRSTFAGSSSSPVNADAIPSGAWRARDASGGVAPHWTREVGAKAASTCVKNPLKQVCESDIDMSKEADPRNPATLHPAFVDALMNYNDREPKVGSAAPDFSLTNLDGEPVHLAALL